MSSDIQYMPSDIQYKLPNIQYLLPDILHIVEVKAIYFEVLILPTRSFQISSGVS